MGEGGRGGGGLSEGERKGIVASICTDYGPGGDDASLFTLSKTPWFPSSPAPDVRYGRGTTVVLGGNLAV